MPKSNGKTIWIDLDNSPHVPFFKPIMDELGRRGYSLVVTARDCFQVCSLADLMKIRYRPIGRHYGKHKVFKILGSLFRTLQLAPTVLRERPAVAVSHGSRTQQLLSAVLGIPNVMIYDYEHSTAVRMLQPTYVVVPEVIPDGSIRFTRSRIRKYPGIKEDVYVPDFRPEPELRKMLGIGERDIVATIRPPASEAHYRSPESDKLFAATIEHLAAQKDVRMVMLPRNERQAELIRTTWPRLCSDGAILIPDRVVDGLNLIWHSDFVVSGGGTMNREAAALGVPVYSIFRGKTGAVDRYLSEKGRLVMLESPDDVHRKMIVTRRSRENAPVIAGTAAREKILSTIEEAAHEA